ncbi:FAD-binding oxidoreductase [Saccharopolyspora spinosa]|uniref:FAD-binding oxidoreductase n=1 Tax=Saccharopolyspora spinosa TaxID=60894 RepID=UPI0002EDB435|nr:FAD-binding oxidoreductase [Saccharopolyspora spinosa]
MTPDNLPLLGAFPDVTRLWSAVAISVTSAGAAARGLVELMCDKPSSFPDLDRLRPHRFAGQDPADLEARALRLDRDIYSSLRRTAVGSASSHSNPKAPPPAQCPPPCGTPQGGDRRRPFRCSRRTQGQAEALRDAMASVIPFLS